MMIRKTAGIFSIIVGVSLIGMWLMFYFTGSIPELATEPARITMHLTAEFATALALIVGGWGLLKLKAWGEQLYLLATGALIYTMIQSPGYFLQTGDIVFVVMFAVLILLALVILVKLLREA
jgi:peptidoglycan/LPS O-acetylase OafA/YrhL